MYKKIVKLALSSLLLAGALTELAPKAAAALPYCADMCCTSSCTSFYDCYWTSSGCRCSPMCSPAS